MAERAITGHKLLAMGEEYPSGDFGVEKLGSGAVNGPAHSTKILGDHERAGRPPIKGNQANPDHGEM